MRELGDGYDFAHEMLRESAYAQVSPPRRWLLHRRVAQGLELRHADDLDAVAAQLAEQYDRAGRDARAVDYYRRAAGVAASRFGYAEAIRLHRRALSVIERLPAGPGRDARELAVLEALAAPLNARHGYSSAELQQTLERSVALAESLGRTDAMVTGMVALWTTQYVQGRLTDSYRLAVRALELVTPGSELAGPAHFVVGGSAVSLGKPAEGLRHFELAAKLADPPVVLSIGTRSDVHSTAYAAHAHWLLGHEPEALAASRAAVALARAGGGPYNLAMALAYAGVTHQMRDSLSGLREAVGELRELCDRYDFAYYREWGLILDGWSRPDGGGIDLARRGIATLKAQNSFARMPYWLSLLADLLARNGQPVAARASLDAALSVGRVHDDVWWLPEVMRMRAAYDEEPDARGRLRSAARLAAGHGSIALLRRCEDDLGRRGANGARTERSLRSGLYQPALYWPSRTEGHAMTASATETGYEELAAAIRGDLIRPGDPGYDQARAVYNAMIDKHPQAIARVRDTADVIACVRFARARAIPISVRGGGHNAAGLGVGDGVLVIDLSMLRGTTVSPDRRTVRADAGCTWGDVDHATVAFGMATPSGFLSSTGVAGLTLGGGIGYLSRRFGLTVDNLLAADVVLADGTFVTARQDSHPDLFWALRGGGGNFGVVTSFTFRCHPIGEHGTVIGGPVFYDLADTAAVMRWYRDLMPSLPEELSGWIALLTIPPAPPFPQDLWGRKACGIVWCYTGPHARADEILEPVRTFGSPLLDGLQPMPFTALQSAFDALYPAGLQWYWKTDFFRQIPDAAIDVHARYGAQLPTGHSTMHLYPIDGAASRVAADATAFPYRPPRRCTSPRWPARRQRRLRLSSGRTSGTGRRWRWRGCRRRRGRNVRSAAVYQPGRLRLCPGTRGRCGRRLRGERDEGLAAIAAAGPGGRGRRASPRHGGGCVGGCGVGAGPGPGHRDPAHVPCGGELGLQRAGSAG
jgi:tetratricopeptide (TPR) repeat protein